MLLQKARKISASFPCIYAIVNWANGNVTFTPVYAIGLQVKLLLLNFFSINEDSHTFKYFQSTWKCKIKSTLESLMFQS